MIQQSKGNRPNPALSVKEISDVYIRENFNALARYFLEQNQLLNFKFLEFTFDGPVSQEPVPHGLGFVPKDILRAKVTGPGVCTFNHDLFDDQFLNVTTSGAVRVRCFVGTYFRDASQINSSENDTEDFFAKIPTIPGKNGNITSVIRAYLVQDSDDLILVGTPNDSDSTPITLPDATLSKGRSFQFMKNDDNFIQHQILPFKSTQLIDGQSNTTLCSFRERVTLQSDGENWRTLIRDYPKEWRSTSYANLTPSAGFGTVTSAYFRWRRDGDSIIYRCGFFAGTVAASVASLGLPTNIRFDTTKFTSRGHHLGIGAKARAASTALFSTNDAKYLFFDGTTNSSIFIANSTVTTVFEKINVSAAWSNSEGAYFDFSMPVTGWRG